MAQLCSVVEQSREPEDQTVFEPLRKPVADLVEKLYLQRYLAHKVHGKVGFLQIGLR